MEQICETLRAFLISALPDYLEQLADSSTPLPSLTENNVKVGSVNIEQQKFNQCAFILPDNQTVAELTMDTEQITTRVDVFVFVRNAQSDVLFRQALRYGMAVKKAIQNDYSCGGAFEQASVIDFEYFDDVEASDSKIRACRLGINIIDEMVEE